MSMGCIHYYNICMFSIFHELGDVGETHRWLLFAYVVWSTPQHNYIIPVRVAISFFAALVIDFSLHSKCKCMNKHVSVTEYFWQCTIKAGSKMVNTHLENLMTDGCPLLWLRSKQPSCCSFWKWSNSTGHQKFKFKLSCSSFLSLS
jgi:hypothetical protein